ncbi:restriction endonuclease subunit S [Campylobacter sp. RM10532]|uniref:restriction endonuclease subunit S n=1 Tax=Campylobacter molothri TaxID=1032242 RepID=UPI00301D10CF|nr:restriction endonuclease subunit S [Campylobacter sp. RM10532]
MSLNQNLQEKYPHLELSVLKLSEAKKDNESFRIDSEFFKKEYLKNEEKIKININLGSISSKICNGSTPTNGNFERLGIPFFRSQDFNILDTMPQQFISHEFHNQIIRSKVKYKDILIAVVGATLGQIGFVRKDIVEANINQNIARIRIIDNNFNPYFIFIFLSSYFGQFQIKRLATQTAQEYINNIQVSKIKIPILPMSFQQEIEKMVKDSHKALEESKALYKKAEETLYLELGLDPIDPLKSIEAKNQKNLNTSIRSLKESFLKTGRLDSEYYQEKYEEIENKIKNYKNGFCKLKDLIDELSGGFAFSSKDYQDNGELLLIRINNIKNATLDLSNVIYLKNEAYSLSPRDKIKKGDILISMSGSIGLSCVVREDITAMTNQRILKISIKNFNSDVLVLILNSFICKMQFERIGTGGVQTNLSSVDMQNILIPKIDLKIQEKISKYIEESFSLRKKSKELLDNAKIKVEQEIENLRN